MFANSRILQVKIAEDPNCPLQTSIKHYSKLHILRACGDEQINEIMYLMQFAPESSLYVDGLGYFKARLSGLKHYLYECINRIKDLRRRLAYFKENFPDSKPERTQILLDDIIIKFRITWGQLEVIRKAYIMKNIKWNLQSIKEGKPEKINFHYERIHYKFVLEHIKNRSSNESCIDKNK